MFLLLAGGAASYFLRLLSPVTSVAPYQVRYKQPTTLTHALKDMEDKGAIRSAWAMGIVARLTKAPRSVAVGTYQITPGKSASYTLRELETPIVLRIHLPGNFWAERTAKLLERKGVCPAESYRAAIGNIDDLQKLTTCPLPKENLDGYLMPGDYDLAPLMDGQEVARMQIKRFNEEVWEANDEPKDIHRLLTVASMVQLEAKEDKDRPLIASVIENRIKKGMPLQIDATVCYARREWGRLTFKQIREAVSPYNTYLNKNLPPGPICSPNLKSIAAARNPASTNYLYYVADLSGYHMFSASYEQHLKNVQIRKAEIKKSEWHSKKEPSGKTTQG